MIAGRRSKTVAFVAILAALTFGALATASAQPADINVHRILDFFLKGLGRIDGSKLRYRSSRHSNAIFVKNIKPVNAASQFTARRLSMHIAYELSELKGFVVVPKIDSKTIYRPC